MRGVSENGPQGYPQPIVMFYDSVRFSTFCVDSAASSSGRVKLISHYNFPHISISRRKNLRNIILNLELMEIRII